MTPDPYCGPAPLPDTLWAAWNFDPALLAALAALGLLFSRLNRAAPAPPGAARPAQAAALILLAAAFVSPLCALSSALFSARVLHHVLLVAFAAPALVLALSLPARIRLSTPSLALLCHTALLWLWHAPFAYRWALGGIFPYWVMELTLLLSAMWLWTEALRPGRHIGAGLAVMLGAVVQMGLLGALLTFAREPLYAAHFLTTTPFRLTPLEDQQLAGLLMWVPAAIPYVAMALARLTALLAAGGRGEAAS